MDFIFTLSVFLASALVIGNWLWYVFVIDNKELWSSLQLFLVCDIVAHCHRLDRK